MMSSQCYILCLIFALVSVSCEKRSAIAIEEDVPVELASERLKKEFPLYPVIEAKLWLTLLEAEGEGSGSKVQKLVSELKSRHPFFNNDESMSLGGITFRKDSGEIVIPAVVNYPREGDERHPSELELILCNNEGRTHETLFTCDVRPLHLELLMHLAGYKKSGAKSAFKVSVSIPNHEPIPVEELIQLRHNGESVEPLTWVFSGSEFGDFYQPDQTGDLLICWQVHDSVMSVDDEKIALGVRKLIANKHPKLSENLPVKLILTPVTGADQ